MAGEKPDITPEMKLRDLLEHYPDLLATLTSMSPRLHTLQDPDLRRTMAAIADLGNLADAGKVPVDTMIQALRSAAGLDRPPDPDAGRPAWAKDPSRTFDARETILGGGNPMDRVMDDLSRLALGEVYELITPFVPEPLLDVAKDRGLRAWATPDLGDGEVRTYFTPGRGGKAG